MVNLDILVVAGNQRQLHEANLTTQAYSCDGVTCSGKMAVTLKDAETIVDCKLIGNQ